MREFIVDEVFIYAARGTRTLTGVHLLSPEPSASTNSAIAALYKIFINPESYLSNYFQMYLSILTILKLFS